MSPDEYGICVSSGWTAIRASAKTLEAEASVYVWGGRHVARFVSRKHHPRAPYDAVEIALRADVREQAEQWIAEHS